MITAHEIVARALANGTVIPAFNVPYLPMMEPVVRAVRDCNSVAFIDVARLEWIKFEARGPKAVRDEHERCGDPRHTRLHLDHVPVIDEDLKRVDFLPIMREAIVLGYDSLMIDGSRLDLEENIEATRTVCELAHAHGIPVEGELGAVLGHEEGPLPDYEELFRSGRGFTDPYQAERFVKETGVDWLSIAFGNIHGPITPAARKEAKPAARLSIEHLRTIRERVRIPIVLHGGSGIPTDNVREAIAHGVAKINIASDIRRPYEAESAFSQGRARELVHEKTIGILKQLGLTDSADLLGTKE